MRLNRNHHVKRLNQPVSCGLHGLRAAPLNSRVNGVLNQFVKKALALHLRTCR
jgi:hypothetical protein